jgi:hypothetical protein
MRGHRWMTTIAGTTAALAALGATAGGASAQSLGKGTADGVAGYTAPATSQVSAQVVVPTVDCSGSSTYPVFATVSLSGTDASSEGVDGVVYLSLNCGSDLIQAQTSEGDYKTDAISAGDVIRVSVAATPTGETESYDDLTSGATGTVSGPGFTPASAAADVSGVQFGGSSFPSFSPIAFSKVKVDGAQLKKAAATRYYQADNDGTTLITATKLAHGSFSARFVSN